MDVIDARLTVNKYSRPGIALKPVRALVLHWVENAGTSAMFNRHYFERRKFGMNGFGSAHFIVDLSGEIVLCIPPIEIAYHVGENKKAGWFYTPEAQALYGVWPNATTIGIEMCHLDWEGRYTAEEVEAAARLCASLCEQFDLDPSRDIVRHRDIVAKVTARGACPKWYCEHSEDFEAFKQRTKLIMLEAEV